MKFLSTPSGWRATLIRSAIYSPFRFLSTPSGWRATFILIQKLRYYFISIHALRVEGDSMYNNYRYPLTQISIHALRVEGDSYIQPSLDNRRISIHALRVEGDSTQYS